MTHIKTFAAALLLSAGLSACQTTDADKTETETAEIDPRRGEEVKRVCSVGRINGFGETTRNTVVVRTGVNKHHLLEVAPGCYNLEHAQSIAFDSFGSCITRGDKIHAFESFTGPSEFDRPFHACRVTKIYEWNQDADKEVENEEDTSEQAS